MCGRLVSSTSLETLFGTITSLGFRSGHRFVIGHWQHSPIGPFADIMWAQPDGHRVLLASPPAAEFVTSVYPFEDIRLCMVSPLIEDQQTIVEVGDLAISFTLGKSKMPFPPRPRWITATIENQISQILLGVNTFGISPSGVSEWYRSRSLRFIKSASGSLNHNDLGTLCPVERPLGFGFTDPPRRPAQVRLRVDLRRNDPTATAATELVAEGSSTSRGDG